MRRVNQSCYGCASCACVCPMNAIEMKFDEDGFYAAFKNDACIDCGLCERHCISIQGASTPLSKTEVFASEPRDRRAVAGSSSGGLAHLLALQAIRSNKRVFGCSYDTDLPGARHVCVDSQEGLQRIQGSLYLMSNFSGLKDFIDDTESGAIFGTPCQIAGAHAALVKMRRREDYLLVDIFCHGVPSQIAWTRHLKFLERMREGAYRAIYRFRDGKKYILSGMLNDTSGGLIYNRPCGQDGFFRLFLQGSIFNKTCYSCPYRRSSLADIRLGDLAIGDYLKLENPPSCVIANTEAGVEALNSIAGSAAFKRIDYSVMDNVQDKGTRSIPPERNRILNELKSGKSPNELERKRILISALKTIGMSFVRKIAPRKDPVSSIYEVDEQ